MASFRKYALPALASLWLASPAQAQTTLTMSSWAPPAHPLTSVVLQGFADEVENASGGRPSTRLPGLRRSARCATIWWMFRSR
jgi:TRAP-type C4-dicarboxylate transport system substrate-binding protein